MSKDYKNSAFKELLDRLQQESWQLELLISGFAIFGLFSAIEPIDVKLDIAEHDQHLVDTLLWFAAKICCWILIANLLIHVVLRGLWIGALGLRYVSGDIDYEELKYAPKFTKYLSKKIGSFDKYIATLENYCSVLFAISFLFVFYFLACFLFVITLLIIATVFLSNDASGVLEDILQYIGIGLLLFTLLGILLTFIDFITQGFLKKKKWTAKFYFPLYRVFSLITISFLYRPLVYNFLDNRFGRRLSFILVPVYISILYFFTLDYRDSNYLDLERNSSAYYANPNNYEDMILKDNDFINVAAIPSKTITKPHLKVFMVFNKRVEDRMFAYNEGLVPKKDLRGMESQINIFGDDFDDLPRKKRDSLLKMYYRTFNEMHNLYIDNKKQDAEFIASTNKNRKLGFETYLDIKDLTPGKHLLKITRKRIRKKDTANFTIARIPFWSFKTN